MTAPAKGTGTSGFGTGAYGAGTPPQAPIPGGLVFRDARGVQQNCAALLEPVAVGSQSYALTPSLPKLHYVYDEFGRRAGAPDVVHMVTLALATIKGSAVDPALGQTFGDIRKVTDSFEADMRAKVEDALSNVVARKLIRIDAVTCTPGNGAPAFTKVLLTDMTTQEPLEFSA